MTTLRTLAVAAFSTLVTLSAASAQITDRPSQSGSATSQSRSRALPPSPTPMDPSRARGVEQQQPFEAPDFVSTILRSPLSLLGGDDRQAAKRRLFYLAGFSIAADKTCDFLSMGTVKDLLRTISPAIEYANGLITDELGEALLQSVSAGFKDGKAYMARNPCQSNGGRQVSRSLSTLWEAV